MKTFWISFANETGNLGACILDAISEEHAVKKAEDLRIHPGGEVLMFDITGIDEAEKKAARIGKNRLISTEELLAGGHKKLSEIDPDEADQIESDGRTTFICEAHSPYRRTN